MEAVRRQRSAGNGDLTPMRHVIQNTLRTTNQRKETRLNWEHKNLGKNLETSSVIYGKILSTTHNQAAAAQEKQQQQEERISTVRLLITGASTATTEPAQHC